MIATAIVNGCTKEEHSAKFGTVPRAEDSFTDRTSTCGQLGPIFHLPADHHGAGDLNAIFTYKGAFHLMQQWVTEGPPLRQGWGHLVSDDLRTWRRLPFAVSTDEPVNR